MYNFSQHLSKKWIILKYRESYLNELSHTHTKWFSTIPLLFTANFKVIKNSIEWTRLNGAEEGITLKLDFELVTGTVGSPVLLNSPIFINHFFSVSFTQNVAQYGLKTSLSSSILH